jgi:hypothetical protein
MTARDVQKGQEAVLSGWNTICSTSPSWHSLKPVARAAYIEVAKLYNGTNNGYLAMSGRRLAEAMPISRQTGTRSLEELVEKGFLEVVTPSAFSLKIKRATEYRLTAFGCDVKASPPSKAFMKWTPEIKTRPQLKTLMAS